MARGGNSPRGMTPSPEMVGLLSTGPVARSIQEPEGVEAGGEGGGRCGGGGGVGVGYGLESGGRLMR